MGLFNRGQGASSLILDEARAFRAYLGDQLVWDGTMDAFVPAAHIMVSVTMADPAVSATALTVAPFISASAQVHEPSVSGTAIVRPETAILVSGAVHAPDVSADALIDVPAISVTAIVLAPTVSEAFDATVEAPIIQVTAGMYSPQITVDYASTVPIIAAFAELLAPLVTATGTAVVNAPMIAVTGTLPAPIVRGASAVAAPMIAVSATVLAPQLRRDAKVIVPLIATTATAYTPNVQAINFTAMGVILPTANSWTSTSPRKSLGWSADPAFPGTVVASDGIQVNGSKIATVAFDLTYRWAWTGTVNVAAYVGGVQRGSTVSWGNPNSNADYNKTGEIAITVAANEVVDLYVWTSHSFAFIMRNTSKWSIT